MTIKEMSMEQVNDRIKEIRTAIDAPDADLDALDKKYGEKRYRSGRGSYRGGRRGGRKGYNRHHEDSYSENGEQIEPVQIPDTGSADSSSID